MLKQRWTQTVVFCHEGQGKEALGPVDADPKPARIPQSDGPADDASSQDEEESGSVARGMTAAQHSSHPSPAVAGLSTAAGATGAIEPFRVHEARPALPSVPPGFSAPPLPPLGFLAASLQPALSSPRSPGRSAALQQMAARYLPSSSAGTALPPMPPSALQPAVGIGGHPSATAVALSAAGQQALVSNQHVTDSGCESMQQQQLGQDPQLTQQAQQAQQAHHAQQAQQAQQAHAQQAQQAQQAPQAQQANSRSLPAQEATVAQIQDQQQKEHRSQQEHQSLNLQHQHHDLQQPKQQQQQHEEPQQQQLLKHSQKQQQQEAYEIGSGEERREQVLLDHSQVVVCPCSGRKYHFGCLPKEDQAQVCTLHTFLCCKRFPQLVRLSVLATASDPP